MLMVTLDLDNVNIAGVTTFASNIDADGDLASLDGHTNLDNVNVSGAIISTIYLQFGWNS